ncbi:glycosyl transferase family 2 [Sphingobacterium sp. Ag1]|uniref:glycosyltransferase family 2 protein n=1 Tax=Sphingobacterium sp. Ag1 TaxID=1643451 RepID=UPI0006275587|nr:glycosyltransferase [Sphingobacterium sp. Ag1]KKO89235.1 glycosyl transferase family 2 [Sphingobacterium sp. Ag1]
MVYFFTYLIYFYATFLGLSYLALMIMSYYNTVRYRYRYTQREENYLRDFPEKAPAVSIVAPAFNEEVIISDSVHSLLNLDYPNFEVVVVNDGSKDKTLDILIKEFELEEVPYYVIYKVHCKPIKRLFRSTNPEFNRLIVIDKENGGTKADAINAGINIAQYDYFINTDVDCILSKDSLGKIVLPILDSDKHVIAVGATMRMANGCTVDNGRITRVKAPSSLIPLFQETEYLRSYLVGKMGWDVINAIPNVSGGYGLFDTQIIIAVGGFDSSSHAEDMDMTARIAAYMLENERPYRIAQCPYSLCWTEGPPNLKVLSRQRSRWGRGLFQFLVDHRKLIFNKDYGRLGFIVLPYTIFFEFLAPIIEFVGLLFMIFLLITHQINFDTFWMMLLYAYLIGFSVSVITVLYDLTLDKLYRNFWEYLKLVLFSALEPILYHPFIVIFTLRGYIQYLTRRDIKWGKMTRKGFSHPKNA